MENISDIIEKFILKQLEDDSSIELSRNELANFFDCAPSQINYVLSTRFTHPRGFLTESRRGGGGYIRLIRLTSDNEYINQLINKKLSNEISFIEGKQILLNLFEQNFITEDECKLLINVISKKSLINPFDYEDKIRTNILKNLLINILRED